MNAMPKSCVATLTLSTPSLQNNTADAERLTEALKTHIGNRDPRLVIDLDLLRQIPELLRAASYRVKGTFFKDRGRWILTDLRAADAPSPLGLAVDLGTTRVVLRLVELESGAALGETAEDNPQVRIGPDVLTRIHFADQPHGLQTLQRLITDSLNRRAATLCQSCGRRASEVVLVSLAGNTAMTHLLLGLTPHWMIREPYLPVVNRPGLIACRELGLQLGANARVFIFPNIGSYFGGDLVAGILFSGMHRSEEIAFLVDVGTNAEVVLGNSQWLIGCAGAAGPALEGGVTRMGMTAGPGVIDRVEIDAATGAFHLHTIGKGEPRGICGSGLIDLTAQLLRAGMIDIRGKFQPRRCGDRLKSIEGLAHLTVVPSKESATGRALTINQADLDSLIRSKAAMYTILETVGQTVGAPLEGIRTFFVCGTFGTYIQPQSAITIGMIPDLPLEAYRPLGNSSLGGAARLLTNPRLIDEIDTIRDRITYLELNVNQDFMNRFSAAKFLPHTDRKRFPSVILPED
jgi:uncharacterized 2Fe-2S/4Fe-4S cluster protein (DUF4445 family)